MRSRSTPATPSAPGVKDVFSRDIRLEGDLSEEERQRLLEIADRCPVSRTLTAGVEIRTALVDDAPVGEATS